MFYSFLNYFVKYDQDEANLLSMVENWWESEENPQKNNPFSEMTLPVQHQNEIYRGISTMGRSGPVYMQLMSSRFFIKYNRYLDIVVFDMYHDSELKLQFQNLSGFQLDDLIVSNIKFIQEKTPRFAICVLLGPSETYLGVFEIDVESGKLIMHQLFDLNVPNNPGHFEDRSERAYLPCLLLDQQELLSKDLSTHLICIFNHDRHYTKKFQVKFLKSGVPTIISQSDIGTEPWWRCKGIFNQKAYTSMYPESSRLQVIDLRLPRIIGQDPRTIVNIENFDRTYKWRMPQKSHFHFNSLYYLYHNNETCIEFVVVDLEILTWKCVYRFKTSSIGQVYNFGVDGNELIVVCQKDSRLIAKSAKIKSILSFPTSQPLSLTKLTFFAVRRLNLKYPKLNIPEMKCFNESGNFKKSQRVKDNDFERFCLQENQRKLVSNVFNNYCSVM